MARIINVEKSKYITDNIEIYSSNKVGQYSKYLDKNPLFITYFHINSAQTRNDVGTGGVNADLGPNSPIRFNQINNLPMYNIPELKPSTDFGENGYDIDMEINDAVLLPNTVKPSVGDYFLIELPGTIEFLFRVNSFEYNTIQSNDFYTLNADLKHTGHELIKKIDKQIVQEYETIFENIGTDDKCFILSKDVEKIQSVGKILTELKDSYYNNFFDKETGTFVCKNVPKSDIPDDSTEDYWLYDKFLEKFIMDSKIYYVDNSEKSIVLTCADLETPDMGREYSQTLWYSVLNNTLDFLAPYPYYYKVDITRRLSPFVIYHINCKGVNLVLTKKELILGHSDALDSGTAKEYFPHYLIKKLLKDDEEIIENDTRTAAQIWNDSIKDMTSEQEDDPELTYLEEILYNFLTNSQPEINKKKIIPYTFRVDEYTYRMMPLVMYVIMKYYDSYFVKEEL